MVKRIVMGSKQSRGRQYIMPFLVIIVEYGDETY
jgi:hypothetical protein